MSERYNIIFTNILQEGQALPTVKIRLAELFKTDPAHIAKLFNSPSSVIKSGLSKETALKYQHRSEML